MDDRPRVLVTGGSGFIGRHLLTRLHGEGREVVAISRRHPEDLDLSVEWRTGDLAETDFVKDLFEAFRPNVVFHLASHVTGSRSRDVVLPTLRSNLVSAVHVLTMSEKHDVGRVVLAGSLEEPDSSESNPIPCSPYAASKWAASAYGRMFHRLYDLSVTVARIFMVYGPGPQDQNKLVPYTIRSCIDGRSPEIASGGRPVDWIFVEDVVEGLLRVARSPGLGGDTVDLGSGTLVTIREVVEEITRLCDVDVEPAFDEAGGRAFERVDRANVERTKRLLDWAPSVSLREGLGRTIEWFEDRRGEDGGDSPDSR